MIHNCADKLQPLLTVLVGNNTEDHSEVVATLCQDLSAENTVSLFFSSLNF